MASVVYDSVWTSPPSNYLHGSFHVNDFEESEVDISPVVMEEVPASSISQETDIPAPPPRSNFFKKRYHGKPPGYCLIPKETRDTWDTLFKGGYGADVYIVTEEKAVIPAHFSVLSIASLVLGSNLQNSKPKNGIRHFNIPGVPHGAVCTFIRFLYSSSYEEEDMKKFVLHLLLLSHAFVVPLLKRVCTHYLETCWMSTENVIDVLQLANNCDAPRLSFLCVRMVVRHFKTVASSEGWKVMRRANPALEQELLEAVVEEDSRKQDRKRKIEERKIYLQLHEAMEALLHICKDGCSTIGPRDKTLKGSQVTCGYSACKGIETLVRHFFSCRTRVPGGCAHCKRIWQLLELHSQICEEPESCNVPLCRHFKEKMRQQSKKDEVKWKLLVRKVIGAKSTMKLFGAQHQGLL